MPHMLFAAVISLLKALIALLIKPSITATMPLKMLFATASSPDNIVMKPPAIASLAPINKSLIQLTQSVNAIFMFDRSVLAIPNIAVPIVVKKLRIIVSQSSHANLMLSTNHWKSPENNALNALKIADKYSPYVPNVSVIHCRVASHAIVKPCVIDDRVSVIHVTNGSIIPYKYSTADVTASFITSQFVTTTYASHAIAATNNHIGEKIIQNTVAKAPNHAMIAGIARPSVPTTVTNQAIDQAINMILPKSSGFSVARDTKLAITGCTTASNC